MGNPRTPTCRLSEVLTPREIEVMTWTAHGKTRVEISIILSIAEETVKYYTENACIKLKAVNKTHAASKAIALGLIKPFSDFPS